MPVLSVPPEQAAFFVSVLVVMTPAGRLSVTFTLLSAESLGGAMLMVRELVPPGEMLTVPKLFEPVMGRVLEYTFTLALLEALELHIAPLPLLKQASPTGMVLV